MTTAHTHYPKPLEAAVVTGASGFLGQALLQVLAHRFPTVEVQAIGSPRSGGCNLEDPRALDRWASANEIKAPQHTALIHVAAKIDAHAPNVLEANRRMAENVAHWAKRSGLGFAVLASSISVHPLRPEITIDTPCEPANPYGLGKLAAEEVWRNAFDDDARSIVRFAGIWGWQRTPNLFWNDLLRAAAAGDSLPRPVAKRRKSTRNYLPVESGAVCLAEIAARRIAGTFLAAGTQTLDTGTYVASLERLPGSDLRVEWVDDGQADEVVCVPSPELSPWLTSVPEALSATWAAMPDWVRHL
jgi:nucleoside-diphosphate-sugar epimerase